MKASGWFDSHVHLDRLAEPSPARQAVADAARVGVTDWLVPGVRPSNWADILLLAETCPGVRCAPGVHPLAAEDWNDRTAAGLQRLLSHSRVVALGEIGLDGLLDVPGTVQDVVFREQLELAIAFGKPVLIHCRRNWGKVMQILRASGAERVGGILHAFGAGLEIALQGWELGFCCGFGGPLTYPNARKSIAVIKDLPAEAILIETDAPDLPPHPYRGVANRPEWLPLIAEKVAEIRGWSLAETALVTAENARRVLRIEPGS